MWIGVNLTSLETIKTNVVGTLTLANVCKEHGLLLVNFATGCIFEDDDVHLEGNDIGLMKRKTNRTSVDPSIRRPRPW
jgi:hypothetical protein